jgi:hypothetical protein
MRFNIIADEITLGNKTVARFVPGYLGCWRDRSEELLLAAELDAISAENHATEREYLERKITHLEAERDNLAVLLD